LTSIFPLSVWVEGLYRKTERQRPDRKLEGEALSVERRIAMCAGEVALGQTV
jgi:hypothetical protein